MTIQVPTHKTEGGTQPLRCPPARHPHTHCGHSHISPCWEGKKVQGLFPYQAVQAWLRGDTLSLSLPSAQRLPLVIVHVDLWKTPTKLGFRSSLLLTHGTPDFP